MRPLRQSAPWRIASRWRAALAKLADYLPGMDIDATQTNAVTIPFFYPAPPDVCPSCGRCRTCGQPAPQPPFQPVNPYPWPYIGPIWVAPLTPEQGAPYFTVSTTIADPANGVGVPL